MWQVNSSSQVKFGIASSAVKVNDDGSMEAASLTLTMPLAITSGGTGASTAASARTNLGSTLLGDALFTATSAAAARSSLGLGTMATQDAHNVAITGGTISGVTITGTVSGAAIVAGNTGQVQFNNNGDLDADSLFTWDIGNQRLGIGTAAPVTALDVNGTISGSPSSGYLIKQSGINTGLYVEADGALTGFRTGNRGWTINTLGHMGIGTATPASILHIQGSSPTVNIRDSGNSGTTGTAQIRLTNSAGTQIGYIGQSGTANVDIRSDSGSVRAYAGANVCVYSSGASWSCSSDRRRKRQIQPLTHSLDKLLRLQGVSYVWRDSTRADKQRIGLIAQDVETVYPQLVSDNNGTKVLDYSALVAPLIEGVKELKSENKSLRDAVDQITAELSTLRTETEALLGQFSDNCPSVTRMP